MFSPGVPRCKNCQSPFLQPTANSKATNFIQYTCLNCLVIYKEPAQKTIDKFSCRYVVFGCTKQLPEVNIKEHEKACDYRIYSCLKTSCIFQSSITRLKSHIAEYHPDIIIKRGFHLPRSEAEMSYVMIVNNELFVVQYRIHLSIFFLTVKYVGKPPDTGKFIYEAEIRYDGQEYDISIILYNGKMKNFEGYQRLDEKADIKYQLNVLDEIGVARNFFCHINITEKKPNRQTKNNISENEQKKESLEDKSVASSSSGIEKIKEMKTDEKISMSGQKSPMLDEYTQKNMLKELECPVCQEYMYPPIFICSLGHSICNKCKHQLSKCPTCSSEYGNTRNLTLENMLELIHFPCQNEVQGCTFLGDLHSSQEHNKNCKYNITKCPLPSDCKWSGNISLISTHLRNKHNNTFIKLDHEIKRDLNLEEAEYNFVEYKNEVFRISCRHRRKTKNSIQWSFQKMISKTLPEIYKFEIQFIDQTANDRRFIINDVVREVTNNNTEIFNNALTISFLLLRPYIDPSNLLHYKLRIY